MLTLAQCVDQPQETVPQELTSLFWVFLMYADPLTLFSG